MNPTPLIITPPGALDHLWQPVQKRVLNPGKARKAADPVVSVWPGTCDSGDHLARGLCGFHQFFPEGCAANQAFLFMAGTGPHAIGPDQMGALLTPWLDEKNRETAFGVELVVSKDVDPELARFLIHRLKPHGLKLILWTLALDATDLPRSLFYQVSRWGIWNHVCGRELFRDKDLAGPGAWMANNPNIVHSFNCLSSSTVGPCGAADPLAVQVTAPKQLQSYGSLPAPAGVPFWHLLGNAGNILAALCRMEAKALRRLRADQAGQTTFTLGSSLEFHFKKPADIDSNTMDQIVAMVDAGGSVDITHVRANLETAYLIAYATEKGIIAGNSSLKHPRKAFIDRLYQTTGLDFTNFVERGYTSVRPEYRAMGIGERLLDGLTCRATDVKVFSLISEDNLATQKIAIRNKTRKIAVYFSEKVGKNMGVWMPEHMIDSRGKSRP